MIKLIKSTFHKEKDTFKSLERWLKTSPHLSFGAQCIEFEKKFAAYQKQKDCVFVNSGSSANLALIQALLNLDRLKKGDLVGVSALTWSTNVMPLIQLGLKPIPIDVELENLNVSSQKLGQTLAKFPLKAVFITNLLGFCADLDEIKKICDKRKIILLEDNCEALGSVYRNRKLGSFGLAGTFSFYVGHHMSTIEGGAICTNDKKLATMLRIVRAHGWDRNLNQKEQISIRRQYKIRSEFVGKYSFYDLGFNLRPTEINGFLGNLQIQYLDEIVKKRVANLRKFSQALYKQSEAYYPLNFEHMEVPSNFAVPVACKTKKIRDKIVKKCAEKVEIRPIVGGINHGPAILEKYGLPQLKDSNVTLIHENGFYFGNNPDMTESEVGEIIKILAL